MKIIHTLSDDAILVEIGARLARYRLNRNLTQAALAEEAGLSLPTVSRIESGKSSQLNNLIRLIRALGLLENLDALIPVPPDSPIQQLKLKGRSRQRASTSPPARARPEQPWTWDDPGNGPD